MGPIDHKIEIQTAEGQSPQTFGVDFGSPNGSRNDPKTTLTRLKIQDENASLFYRSWTRLRPVLRRFWAHLGGIFGHFALVFLMCFEHRHFRTNDVSRRIFGQLDPIWSPKRVPKGAQDEPKATQDESKIEAEK